MTVYDKFRQQQGNEPAPSVLAIGDSWFWYPGSNLLDQIDAHPRVGRLYTGAYRLGYNGAASIEYVGAGKFAQDFNNELVLSRFNTYSGFFISGAGNDAVSYPDLKNGPFVFGLKDDCTGIEDPLQCLDEERVLLLLRQVTGALGALVSNIIHTYEAAVKAGRQTGIHIFLHGYTYPVPDGRGVDFAGFTLGGPWVGKPMDNLGVKKDLPFRFAITRELITRLNEQLRQFNGMYDDRVHFIDSEAAFGSEFDPNYKSVWANELHATAKGYKYIVDQYWVPMLKRYGFAT